MRKMFFISLIITGFVISSCSENVTESEFSEKYLYKSYDTTGAKIVEGWLTINYQDNMEITGRWDLVKVGNPANIGPQVGNGNLIGGLNSDKTWIELNPEYRDNNLQLLGTIQQGRFIGEWQYISYSGVTNYGTFEAEKQ